MTIVQDAFYIPNDIETGLATGLYRRIGNVVRYATGPKKGQIVKHLQPVSLQATEQTQSLGSQAVQFVVNHKKGVGLTVLGVALVCGGIWGGYNKWKNYEPKVLVEFRSSLRIYIDAIRNGDMDIAKINELMDSLQALKNYKNYEKISIKLSAEEFEVLVNHIYDYTIKLAQDNNIELSNEVLDLNNDEIINLQSYLATQKRIFELAA